MRRLLFLLLEYCGVNALFRVSHKYALTIVLYHGVAPRERRGIYNYRGKFIEPRAFRRQLEYFKRHYTILALDEAVERLCAGTLPPYALAVTFDDGYRNFYTYAFPHLKALGMTATMFLPTNFVLERKPLWVDRLEYAMGAESGSFAEQKSRDATLRDGLKRMGTGDRERELRTLEQGVGVEFNDFEGDRAVYAPLTLPDIKEMRAGGISFGAHTKSHPVLSRIPDEEAREEICGSIDTLERALGPLSRVFAYPNGQEGDWDRQSERLLEETGVSGAVTTLEGVNTMGAPPFRLRRMVLDATGTDWAFAAITAGVRLWLSRLKHYAH